MKLRQILFPADFSDCGEEALDLATSLARDTGARLLIVHVEDSPTPYGTGRMYDGNEEPTPKQLADMLHAVKPKDPGVAVEYHLLQGTPAKKIVEFAKEQSVDFIVIGTHGRTGLSHLLMGSVAESVVRHAHCPVATVKHPKHKATEPV